MKDKEECEYVDRTQRQYKTALTGALKIQMRKQRYNINLTILCLKQTAVGEETILSETEFHTFITLLPKTDCLYFKSCDICSVSCYSL